MRSNTAIGRSCRASAPRGAASLAKAGLLYLVTEKFVNIDLHPEVVDNAKMGMVFEELPPSVCQGVNSRCACVGP